MERPAAEQGTQFVGRGASEVVSTTHVISTRGRKRRVPAYRFDDVVIITNGTCVRVSEIFDEYWLEADRLPDPIEVLRKLRGIAGGADLFTFAQRIPDTKARFDFHMELDNVAVIPVSSYEEWFRRQISSASRRNIRASEKRGLVVRAVEFDDAYVRGIMSIYDEAPVRHGRRYWHYRKSFATVQAENATYKERSTFWGAYVDDDLVGYLKIVWDKRTAAIMQILSKVAYFDRRPNNALLAEAVRACAERGIEYLLYERFAYGGQTDSSLTRFKEANGFVRMDIPRYYVPLNRRGAMCLRLGLHRDQKERIPLWLGGGLRNLRAKYYWTMDALRGAIGARARSERP